MILIARLIVLLALSGALFAALPLPIAAVGSVLIALSAIWLVWVELDNLRDF